MNSIRRHIHLGTRLDVAEQVRRGAASADEAAARLGVAAADVHAWVASGERPVTFDEVVVPPAVTRLTRRAERLVALIAAAESTIRVLTRRLAAAKGPAEQGGD